MEIPAVWLWISGIAFLLQSVFLIGVTVALVKIMGIVNGLRSDVRPVLNKFEAMTVRVETMARRVDGIAEKVDGLVDMTQGAVDSLGSRAGSIVRSLDTGINTAVSNSKVLIPFMTVLKVIQMVGAIRAAWGGLGFDKSKVRQSKPETKALE